MILSNKLNFAGIFVFCFYIIHMNYLSDMVQRYVVRYKGKVEIVKKTL